jgi:DNA adenine methylase
MTPLRSPLSWIGGKYYSAARILRAFPEPEQYDTYVELFGGAAHVLFQKPPGKHIEVYNDLSGDLVNFWMHCRDHAPELEQRCRSLPYARSLYYVYRQSLFDGSPLDPLERAVRWFYVTKSMYSSQPPVPGGPSGWNAGIKNSRYSSVHAYRSALDLFEAIQKRLRFVLIDQRDFADVFRSYDKPRVLFYVDPPYLGVNQYYQDPFSLADHERLAALLQTAQAYVALSSYPHPLLENLYPRSRWQRLAWLMPKHSQRSATNDVATELLLTNYRLNSLWEDCCDGTVTTC